MRASKKRAVQQREWDSSGEQRRQNTSYNDRLRLSFEGRENLPVIVAGSDAWRDWMEYFTHIGHPHAHPNSYANRVGRLTVPDLLPEMFDPTWRSTERAEFASGTHPPSPKFRSSTGRPESPDEQSRQRENIARMHSAIKQTLGKSTTYAGARDRRDAEAEKRSAQDWLNKNPSGVKSDQPIVSERFLEHLNELFPSDYPMQAAG